MRWVVIAAGGLVAIVALIALIGALLPKGHMVTRAARFHQKSVAIWQAITDYRNFPNWRKGVESVEQLPDSRGHSVWLERGRNDAIPYEMVETSPPDATGRARMVVRIADPKLPYSGTWTYELAEADGDAILRITERGEVYNPIFRFISRFVMSQSGTIETYLNELGRKFAATVSIEE